MQTTEVQYGVRYGDGEIEECGPTEADAEMFVGSLRSSIEAGAFDADDYEPMTIVRRTVVTTRDETPWESA